MEFIILKEIIDEWDPIGLLETHSPLDEYDGETQKILSQISDDMNEFDIATIIYNVFLASFNETVFLKSTNECIIVAKKVLNTRI